MTLIDKDSLLEKLSTFHPDYTFNITAFRNFIKAQPEVEKKGEWIKDGEWKYKRGGRNSAQKELFGTEWRTTDRLICSSCRKRTMVDSSIGYAFCPHCGAKMEGSDG